MEMMQIKFNTTIPVTVSEIQVHPKYNATTHDYDVALLKFTDPDALSDSVGIIPLPSHGIPETLFLVDPFTADPFQSTL